MSAGKQDDGAPIDPGSSLARALGGAAAPGLSPDFAERVIAAAEARPAPPAALRRPVRVAPRGWRMGRRIAIGIASFGALATAAAATGLLGQLSLPVPSARTVWASITGKAPAVPAPKAAVASADPAAAPIPAPAAIAGPIDTPEKLDAAFRRADQLREARRIARAQIIEQRIAGTIERRRAAGLAVPTPGEEAKLRETIGAEVRRREQLADERLAARREALRSKIANGEAITPGDVAPRMHRDRAEGSSPALERLRQMPPRERREALRAMPPEERRAIMEEHRARRSGASPAPELSPSPVPAAPEG